MKALRCATAGLGLLGMLALTAPASALTLDREFRYAPERVSLDHQGGWTHVAFKGGVAEWRAGRPDLPTVGERVELPDGMRVTAVEVTGLDTAPLAEDARLEPALRSQHGTDPEPRTAPDPAFFNATGFGPASPVALGYQGFERGRTIAFLMVAPVRWDPASRRLERVSRVRVRLTLAPGPETTLRRERVVREWEEASDVAALERAHSAALVSVAPTGRHATPFRPTQVPSLLGSPVAYVIVTSDSMAAAFQTLADWKTQCGVPAVVRTTSFIRQQYPFGSDDAERIRMFIRDAYLRWGAKWVLLGGDTEVIPARYAYTTFYGGENIPSDLYYSCLDGNWNANADSIYGQGYISSDAPGDSADLLPEVYVGRAPTETAADAQLFVSKTLQYEKTPISDYMTRLLFFAEVLFPQGWTSGPITLDGAQIIEQDILPILDTTPWMGYCRLYNNYTDSGYRPGSLPESRAVVLDSLNRGYNIGVHVGHGYITVMHCADDNVTSNDAFGRTNGQRVMNMYAIDCTSNAIDFQSIGEAFLHAPNGGGVTNIGSTRFDFPTTGRYYQQEYFKQLFEDSVTAIGQAQANAKLPFVGFAYYDGVHRWTQMTLLLLGDPELRVFTNTPRLLSVTAPSSVLVSDSLVAVNVQTGGSPLAGARVTLYKAGDTFVSGLTDANGNLTLAFRPDSLGPTTLTVTAFNAKPYQSTVTVSGGSVAALANLPATIVDDSLSGRHGNNNGQLDAGELVDIRVPVRNAGGSTASAVNGSLTTTDGMVTIVNPAVSYGSISASSVSSPATGFRISIPYTCPDQREIPFTLTLLDGGGRHYVQTFQVVTHAPELAQYWHVETEPSGNGDGFPAAGETDAYSFRIRNLGTGPAQGVYGRLRNYDGLATVIDTAFTMSDIPAGAELATPVLRFSPSNTSAKLELRVSDQYGDRLVQPLDLIYPPALFGLQAFGAASSIKLTWTHTTLPDLLGYNVYRSASQGGPYTKVNPNPTPETSYYLDSGLVALTRYYYKVSAVDSSGNESSLSAAVSASTNPPLHAIFPVPTRGTTPSPVTIDHIYSGYPLDMIAGSDVLYVLHPDATAPVDADQSAATLGDFTTLGSYYAGGASTADLDGDGNKEIMAATWNDQTLYAWDKLGNLRSGFPQHLANAVWSSIAVGDLLGNGQKEMVFGSRGNNFYAFRSNGTEWMDGDNNSSTTGVFKVLGQPYNDGTPALADLLGNGQKDIIYGSYDGNLYAWKPDGTNVPGFPVNLHAPISASVAVANLDGSGNQVLSIVCPTMNDSVHVIRADGSEHAGYPVFLRTTGNSRTPSPAIADMNNDGYLDIIIAATNGGMWVLDHNGSTVPPWNGVRYSTLSSAASESSPVVADINGDGKPDIVIGDETGNLNALSGDGTVLPGFPIQLQAEVKGTPALCDCDGDGKTEILVAGWDHNLYMWDYDFPFSPSGAPPWPQFHHDAQRTGYYGTPILLDAGPTTDAGPRELELAPPSPNPARVAPRLTFGIPASEAGGSYELAIYDLSGRRVRTLEQGVARGGRFSSVWNLADGLGRPVRNGVYFARLSVGAKTESRKLVVLH